MSLWLDFLGAEIRFIHTPTFGRVRIAEAGRGNGDPLIFMHGLGGHLEAYCKNVVALSNQFHTIAFDFLGCGFSNRDINDFSPRLLADQLAEIMDVLGLERANLSGESLGGMAASAFAVKHPERVLRIMLNTTGLPITSEQGRHDLQALIDRMSQVSHQPPTLEAMRDRMKWLMHPHNWHMLDEVVQTRLAIYLLPDAKLSAPAIFRHIEKGSSGWSPELAQLECETLFLWTRDNPMNGIDDAEIACAKVKRGQLYVMKADAAHWPQYEAPEEFNAVARQFFATGVISDS